jgi:AraC-like DNA-binding protein
MKLEDGLKIMGIILDVPIKLLNSFESLENELQLIFSKNLFDGFNSFGKKEYIMNQVMKANISSSIQIESYLKLKILIVKLEDNIFILLGPYVEDILNKFECSMLLKNNELNSKKRDSLLLWNNNFPVLNKNFLNDKLSLIIKKTSTFGTIKVTNDLILINDDYQPSAIDEDDEFYKKSIIGRYEQERKFMSAIRKGNKEIAIKQWHILHDSVRPIKESDDAIKMAQASAAVTRTIIRIAAASEGISPVLNDKITRKSSKKIRNSSSINQINKEHVNLINTYCEIIKSKHENDLSVLTVSILYFLNNNFTQKFEIKTIAQELNISENHLIQQFKREMKMTPKRYVLNKRLKLSKKLLRETHKKIVDVGYVVGFEDSSYFSRIFKKYEACTPTQYRIKNQYPNY